MASEPLGRSYGDPCGVARALDIVGERWALLVVRELLLGPKRFTDLYAGLAGISQNVLSQRLRELERSGVVARQRLAPPARVWTYALTERGTALEPVLIALGRWGRDVPFAKEAALSPDALLLALRTTFSSELADRLRLTAQLRMDDDEVSITIADGRLDHRAGAGWGRSHPHRGRLGDGSGVGLPSRQDRRLDGSRPTSGGGQRDARRAPVRAVRPDRDGGPMTTPLFDPNRLFEPATTTAALIRRGEIRATELVRAQLERIQRANTAVNALVEVHPEQALTAARVADGAVRRGQLTGELHGIPITIKEAFQVRGFRSTWGNPDWAQALADRDATVVSRLRDAGAIVLGTSNVAEMLGDFGQTSNPVYGRTSNPWDPLRGGRRIDRRRRGGCRCRAELPRLRFGFWPGRCASRLRSAGCTA